MRINRTYYEELGYYMTCNIPWEQLNGKSILIAGATGIIGACLVDLLLYRNEVFHSNIKIIALSRNKENFQKRFSYAQGKENLIYYAADISSELNIQEKPDYIIHVASDGDPISFSTRPVEVMRANFIGMDNILKFAKSKGCIRTLYISSGEVYGQSVDDYIFDESFSGYVDHSSARSCYPAAKRAAEVLCQSYIQEYGMDIVIARPCHIYGPYIKNTDSRVVAQFLKSARAGQDIVMKSNGLQRRSMCYSLDCVIALITILLKGDNAEAYNIADKENVSIRELAELVTRKGNVSLRIELPDEIESRGYNTVKKSILDYKKIYGLGWRPLRNMDSGIEKTIAIMKDGVDFNE